MSIAAFPKRLHERLRCNEPLSPHTTLRVGGPAEYYVEATSLRDVADTVHAARELGLPLHVLGGGSNLLIADEGVKGVVLCLHGMKSINVFGSKVQVQAGANLSTLVNRCSAEGLAGPQTLAGIPGTVGGALAMNAGGRYGEIADYVERVIWINPEGELQSLYREEIKFAYRISELRHGVVIEAVLQGTVGDRKALIAHARDILQQKLAAQPYSEFSAGCAFKNPMGQSAGKIIDLAGCKGLRVGGAQVSDRHGNFIINTGEARAAEVIELMRQVTQRVFEAHGIELQPEVQVWPRRGLQAA
ncbi:MAG: UDP-N-acetylmuramate dehydrogenase [Planctomycetes bacterium]|nr:UDP-N-acetylmuramate dehydrogenase [Planctomycetota bacterium]